MRDLNDKVTGSTLAAAEFNEIPSEIQNAITGSGQALSSGDLTQLSKAIGGYSKATKTLAAAIAPVAGKTMFVESSDGGLFKAVTGAAPGTYSDNGGSYCGTRFIPTGGDGSAAWVRVEKRVTLEMFGADILGVSDSTTAITNAIAWSSSTLNNVNVNKGVYLYSSFEMLAGAVLTGPTVNALSVLAIDGTALHAMPVFKCSAISTDGVLFDSDAYNSGINGVAFDFTAQTAGHGIIFDDAAGTARAGQFLKNVLIYKPFNRGISIAANNKEVYLDTVYVRGGTLRTSAVTQYGIYYEGSDSRFFNIAVSSCKTRCIYAAGGASRWRDVDAWDSQDINVEVTGTSSYWQKLQVDGAGNSAMLIDGVSDEAHFNQFTCINNGLTAGAPVADVRVAGDSRGVVFVDPIMRGATGNIDYAFSDEGTNNVQIIGGRFATSYTGIMDATAEAYWDVIQANFSIYARRMFAITPTDHNQSNPFFTTYTASAPDGWAARGAATAAQITTGLPQPEFTSGSRITSGASGASGIQIDLSATISKYIGQKIRITGLFKGDGTASLGNQVIQIFDDIGAVSEVIPNDATWAKRAVVHTVNSGASTLQIRILSAIDTTSGLVLDATAVKVESY